MPWHTLQEEDGWDRTGVSPSLRPQVVFHYGNRAGRDGSTIAKALTVGGPA